jgi:tetratricopeptide (TPR) repeat protein
MNFNVHRRNRSSGGQTGFTQHKEGRSLKKVTYHLPLESLFTEAKQIYQAQGDLEEAIRLFSQFLAVNSRHNEALYLCGVSELKMGQVEKALARLFAIGDDYHNKPNAMLLAAMALNKLGTSFFSQEESQKALKSSTTALSALKVSKRPSASEASFTFR